MERRVEELLNALSAGAFTDPESILAELRALVLGARLSPTQIAFCSSKLLNSEVSLIAFLKDNKDQTDKLIWKTMSNVLNLLSEYIKARAWGMAEYLHTIKDTCIALMASSTKSSMVQEAALSPLIKFLENFPVARIRDTLDPEQLFSIILDNKLKYEERRIGATLRGALYNMLGLLVHHFQADLECRIPELQQLMYVKLKEEINKGAKAEERALAGLFKGLAYSLNSFSYDTATLEDVFRLVKLLVQPLTVGRYLVPKACLKVLTANSGLFSGLITEDALSVFTTLHETSRSGPFGMRYLAQEACEKVLLVLSDTLRPEDTNVFEYILQLLNSQLVAPDSVSLLPSTVRSLGVFSEAIVRFKGESYLLECLSRIAVYTTQYLSQDTEGDLRAAMLRQKHLAAFFSSYADIAGVLTKIPENLLIHFSDTAVSIFTGNPFVYRKYRAALYSAVAQLIAALFRQQDGFLAWVRVFVCRAMQELLRVPEDLDPEYVLGRIKVASAL